VKELGRTLGERTHLSVLQGTEVLTLLSESPDHAVQAAGWVGRLVPAHCSSSGQALLLDHTREQLRDLLGGVRFLRLGPNTPRSLAELTRRIEHARTRGYAIVDEEFEPGLVAAAAPVRDFRGRIVAALNVSGPKFRLGDRLEEAGVELADAAETLSERLGWIPRPEPSAVGT
jgi:IclR family KDG regulon transcriptional repressor